VQLEQLPPLIRVATEHKVELDDLLVRNNSRQLRHAAAQAVLDKLNGLIDQLAFTAGAGDVWTRGLSGLDALRDDEELVRFSSMLLQAFWAYEEVLHYHRAGVIEEWA